jgi:hypothetical protein
MAYQIRAQCHDILTRDPIFAVARLRDHIFLTAACDASGDVGAFRRTSDGVGETIWSRWSHPVATAGPAGDRRSLSGIPAAKSW